MLTTTDLTVAELTTRYGTVTFERGFEIVEIEGWTIEEGPWLLVFSDYTKSPRRQPHAAVAIRKVVGVEYLVADV